MIGIRHVTFGYLISWWALLKIVTVCHTGQTYRF